MNASLWQLAGWTMIHSLWLGAAVALAGGFLRLACRRATPNARYAISLATLALLAATPIAAAAWLSINGVPVVESILLPPPGGEGWGGGLNQLNAHHPSLTLPLKGREPEVGLESPRPAIIDLAQATPAELDAIAAQQQSPQAIPTNTPAPLSLPPSPLPLPLHPSDHQSPITSHSPPTYSPTHLLTYALTHLPTLWLIGAPLTFTLLATGLVGSERLRRRATPLTAGPAFDACQRLRQTLSITRRVALAVCDDVAQPILVGIVRPLILLPTAALAGWTPEQLDMVLLHELAHVRRWDNLVNLLQRIVESILFFHPAVWLVSRQVRRDREECCDAAVIRHTDRPEAYATLLIDIASRLRLSGQLSPAQSLTVASAMASHPLAGRIRRILNIEAEPMRITRRTLAATLLLPLLLAGAIFYSGASAEDTETGGPGSQNQGGAATGSNEPDSSAQEEKTEPGSKNEPNNNDTPWADKSLEIGVDAPHIRKIYPIRSGTLIDPLKLAEALEEGAEMQTIKSRDGDSTELSIIISAPQKAHDLVHALLSQSLPPGNQAPGAAEISQLQDKIRQLEDLIIKAKQELVDYDVYKDLLRQGKHPGSSELEKAVAEDLDRDPTINTYKSQLFELNTTLQTKLTESKNPNTPEIKRIRAVIQQVEADMAKYQAEASRTLREKYAHIPKNAKLAAEREYYARRKATEAKLAELQQKLADAKAQFSALPRTEAESPYAYYRHASVKPPLTDRNKAAHLFPGFWMPQRPVPVTTTPPNKAGEPWYFHYDGNTSRDDLEFNAEFLEAQAFAVEIVEENGRVALKATPDVQLRNAIQADGLRVYFKPGTPYEQVEELVSGIKQLSDPETEFSTTLNPDGSTFVFVKHNPNAAIKSVADPSMAPASSPQLAEVDPSTDATPASPSEPSAQSDSNAPQTDLNTILAETKDRLQRQLADLKARAAETKGTEAEQAAASALQAKILEWQVIDDARAALRYQRAAATGSSANDAPPTAAAFPNAAAPVETTELPGLLPLTAEDFPSHFIVGPENHLSEFTYEVDPKLEPAIRKRLDDALDILRKNRNEPPPKFIVMWRGANVVSIIAAERAQDILLVDQSTGQPLAGLKRLGRSYSSPANPGAAAAVGNAGGPGSPNQGGEATRSSDKAAETLFTKQGLSLSSEDRSLSLAQDRANERIKAERSMRKSKPRRSIENIKAELETDRTLLQLESDLKNLELKTRSRFPEIESPGRRAAIEETTVRLKAIREQLKIEREAGASGSPNQGGVVTVSNDAQPTADASPDAVPLAQKPETPANDSANAPVDSASPTEQEVEKLRRLFQESDSNEQITKFYTVPQGSRQELETAIGVAAGKLFGSDKPPFHLKWEPDDDALYVTAPQLAHRGYFHVVFAAHKLSQFDYPPDAELPEYQATLAELEKANADAARAMEGLPPAHLPPSPFPTLENQKITDRAYKLLGLELEPLTPEELERVKKLGYNGGLRVAAFDPHKKNGIGLDALLVGLHVWPITDLQSLDAVLTREDLADLSPLRFRTVVKASDSPLKQPEDRIISGRMPIDVDAFRSIQRSLPPTPPNTAKSPNGPIPPADNVPAVTVMQPPVSSISGPTKNHTRTTAYLKISFSRLPGAFNPALSPFDDATTRLTPQEIERQAMNCLALVKSPAVLKAALKSFTPRDVQDLSQDQAVLWILDRLSVTFPGDGEIMELKLEGGDAKEDAALLQAVIDAFIAAMKAPPESPADPNAATDAANYSHPASFTEAMERSRESGKPILVHMLAHNSTPCEQFTDEVLAAPQVAEFIAQHFESITMFADSERAFAANYRIKRVPANVFAGELSTGSFVAKPTPAEYLTQLHEYHKIATTPQPPKPDDAPAADRPANDHKPEATVDAGDAVSLKVAGAFPEAPLDGVFTIEPAGTLPLGPLYGRVAVAGKTVLEAEAAVKEHLSKTLTDVAVQLTLVESKTPSPPLESENARLRMEGLKLLKEFPADVNGDELKAFEEKHRKEGYDVLVQRVPETGAFRVAVGTKVKVVPYHVEQPTFLYDGKTFDQWRNLWKLELNPERRIEAISAMAAFSRAGRGDEAINAILDVAAEYDFSTIDPNDPEGKLKERIIKLFTDYAGSGAYQDPWLPIVLERMQSDPDKWRPLVEMLLYQCMPPHRTQYPGSPPIMSAASVELLKKAVGDDRLSAKVLFLTTLNNVAAHDPDVIRMSKETLQSDDTESSLNLLGRIGFANIDELPEQLEFLFAAEPTTRQTAREILSRSVGPQGRDAVADKLLAILNDPNQSARHADAIRALAMFSKNAGPTPNGYGLSQAKMQEVLTSLHRVAAKGAIELFVPATVASELLFNSPVLGPSNFKRPLTDERMKLLEESTQQLADEEELLLKGTALGEQSGGGFF